ncbi:MAG: DNA double-strand break repair nuclease NurA [Candidatus Aenigmatarchaeota archaeon]|nr:DNA double-strand break repair nuclease NurA [Candidatus Aenigmarchaeota archaeon]
MINNELQSILDNIKKIHLNNKEISEKILKMKDEIELKFGEVIENKLTYKIDYETIPELNVLAIDGGSYRKIFNGIDAFIIKTSGVFCKYVNGKLVNTDYLETGRPKIFFSLFEANEGNIYVGLKRNMEEIKTAIEGFKKFNPDIILLDGSVIPHNSERPQRDSQFWNEYETLIEYLKNLYEIAGNKVVGCIKDSRGKRFLDIISQNIINLNEAKFTNDTIFLNYILKYSERTPVFRFSKGEHYILNDLNAKNNIFCFYFSAAENDFPMRIEFWCENDNKKIIENANKISKIMLMLCKHSRYSVPAPLIEADLRARVNEYDSERLINHIFNSSGILFSFMKRRRDNRPF